MRFVENSIYENGGAMSNFLWLILCGTYKNKRKKSNKLTDVLETRDSNVQINRMWQIR